MGHSASARSTGEHPLTTELVSALRRRNGSLVFDASDLVRFRAAAGALAPDALIDWVRDLSILAMSLRGSFEGASAATQLESDLIDPLCALLEQHGVAAIRAETTERAVAAAHRTSSRKSAHGAGLAPSSPLTGIGMRNRRRDK